MKIKFIVGTLAIVFVAFQGCSKSDITDNASTNSSEATNLKAAVAEVTTTDAEVSSNADVQSLSVESYTGKTQAQRLHLGLSGLGEAFHFKVPHIDSTVIVTVSDTVFPKTITIDYGTGAVDKRGHFKQGKIIISLSDSITHAGAVYSIVYQNFYIDSVQINYNATLTNKGLNASNQWVIESNSEQSYTKNGESSVKKNQETITWVAGFATTDKNDDVYYKSGSGSVVINDTATYSRVITTPLLYDASCKYIKSGVVELTRNGTITTIDYGSGECDNEATVTTNGVSETIYLNSHCYKGGSEFEKICSGFGEGKGDGNGKSHKGGKH